MELAGDLGRLGAELARGAALADAVLAGARGPAATVARSVAARAMPPGPFLEAFRAVADRRIAPWRRALRAGTRRLRRGIEELFGLATSGVRARARSGGRELSVAALEAHHLEPELGPYLETLTAALGPEAPFWQRPPARVAVDAASDTALAPGDDPDRSVGELRAAVAGALARAAAAGAPTEVDLAGEGDARLLAGFERVCEELIEAELDRNRKAGLALVQFGVDLVHAAPIAAGIGTAIATGGLGMDVASLAAGGLGAAMAERFTKFLGAGVAREARARWRDLRGAVLADALVRLALGELAPDLAAAADERGARARDLAAFGAALDRLALPTDAPGGDHGGDR